jgi:hypothetical protein
LSFGEAIDKWKKQWAKGFMQKEKGFGKQPIFEEKWWLSDNEDAQNDDIWLFFGEVWRHVDVGLVTCRHWFATVKVKGFAL